MGSTDSYLYGNGGQGGKIRAFSGCELELLFGSRGHILREGETSRTFDLEGIYRRVGNWSSQHSSAAFL